MTGEVIREETEMYRSSRPATMWPAPSGCIRRSSGSKTSWRYASRSSNQQNKLVEAQRLRMRTTYDLEMMEQMGFCNGIENYSRHIDGREAGSAPHC